MTIPQTNIISTNKQLINAVSQSSYKCAETSEWRQTDRQTDRQAGRQTDRQRERERVKQTKAVRVTETDIDGDRAREMHRETETDQRDRNGNRDREVQRQRQRPKHWNYIFAIHKLNAFDLLCLALFSCCFEVVTL